MTTKIVSLAKNTFREGFRDRLFVAVAVFGVIVLVSSLVIGPLSLGEDARITQDLGLAAISILSFLIAILIGTGIVYREIERRTIYTVVSKPVSRWEFIVGKFLGLSATIGLLVAGMTAVLMIANRVINGGFELQILAAVLLIWMELLLLTALSVLMSTLCSPILGAIFTFMLYVIGHTSADLKHLVARVGTMPVRVIVDVVYYAIPNLEYLNIRSKVTHGVPIEGSYLAFACAYALLYSLVFLTVAGLIFERREFR